MGNVFRKLGFSYSNIWSHIRPPQLFSLKLNFELWNMNVFGLQIIATLCWFQTFKIIGFFIPLYFHSLLMWTYFIPCASVYLSILLHIGLYIFSSFCDTIFSVYLSILNNDNVDVMLHGFEPIQPTIIGAERSTRLLVMSPPQSQMIPFRFQFQNGSFNWKDIFQLYTKYKFNS